MVLTSDVTLKGMLQTMKNLLTIVIATGIVPYDNFITETFVLEIILSERGYYFIQNNVCVSLPGTVIVNGFSICSDINVSFLSFVVSFCIKLNVFIV